MQVSLPCMKLQTDTNSSRYKFQRSLRWQQNNVEIGLKAFKNSSRYNKEVIPYCNSLTGFGNSIGGSFEQEKNINNHNVAKVFTYITLTNIYAFIYTYCKIPFPLSYA